MQKLSLCLNDAEINDYLAGEMVKKRRQEIEKHLLACGSCMEKMVFTYKTVSEFNDQKGETKMKPSWKNNLWLAGAVMAFTLSFFMPRYFIQAMVVTILLGMKWIFDSVNARILIMIYDAWQKGGNNEASKILKNLPGRR